MILNNVEGHPCRIDKISTDTACSRGPSAVAEILVLVAAAGASSHYQCRSRLPAATCSR